MDNTINSEMALKKIDEYLKEINELSNKSFSEGADAKEELYHKMQAFIKRTFEDSTSKINALIGFPVGGVGIQSNVQKQRKYIEDLRKYKTHLIGYKEEIEYVSIPKTFSNEETVDNDTKEHLELIFSKFHSVARQLKHRRKTKGKPRKTLEITDEYDVQDLLHALLRIYFDDIREEDAVPKYATKSSKMDFLLKNESIAVEVKFARTDDDKKRIADEIIIDIERYQSHPNVKELYCFVYDYNKEIVNPAEIEELTGVKNNIEVFVYVKPSL